MSPTEAAGDGYAAVQDEAMDRSGVDAVDLDRPAMRAHDVEAGAGHFPMHDAPDWTAARIRVCPNDA